jgi:dihydroorotate dehydrogenase/Pyruvate/2-oxoacid:ferredoxin oxidoreductase delta subunit
MKVEIAGIVLKNPILIASGPLTSSLDLLKKAEDCGAAGASLKLTFDRVPFPGKLRSHSLPGKGLLFGIDRRLNRDEGLNLMRKAKEQTSLVLMANLTSPSSDLEKWVSLARDFEQAGADMIEANLTCPHIGLPAETLGERVREELRSGGMIGQIPELCQLITSGLKEALRIPVVPKAYSNHPRFLASARAIEEGGAEAISVSSTMPNCLPSPDLYRGGRPRIPLLDQASVGIVSGNPLSKHVGFGKAAMVCKNTRLQVISSGGIATWEDIVETIMWGASAVGVCTHLMWYGFEEIPKMLGGLRRYLEEQRLESLAAVRGLALQYLTTPDEIRVREGAAEIAPEKCNGCGRCLKPGHCVAISLEGEKARVAPARCIGCSICVNLCPRKAIRMESSTD